MINQNWLLELAQEMDRVSRAHPEELPSWSRMMAPKIAKKARMMFIELGEVLDAAAEESRRSTYSNSTERNAMIKSLPRHENIVMHPAMLAGIARSAQ